MNAQYDQTQVQEPANRRNFTMSDLLPEPLTFTWVDGTVYDARTPDMFGATDANDLKRTERSIRQAQQDFARAHTDEQKLQVVARMEQQVDRFIGMIIPELPAPYLKRINTQKKLAIITWWGEEVNAQAQTQSGEAGASQPNRTSRRRSRRNRR